jgi:hypothetical protein
MALPMIGRKEITTFFYIYMMLTMTSLILDSGVIPPGSNVYPYFTAVQNGFTSALCTCLLVNGFVGFQIYEDGTTQSVWLLRATSIGMFFVSGTISILTFKSKLGLGPTNTLGLFVILYVINGIFLLVYVIMQVILVTNTLQDRWPLGDILFGVFFFVIGQVIMYVFSDTICNNVEHYLDGLFFATICNLLAVMMVYKVSLHSRSCRSNHTPSPEKTWSSVWARNKATGKSKNCCPKKIAEQPCTRMGAPNMPAACTFILLPAILISVCYDSRLALLPNFASLHRRHCSVFWHNTGVWALSHVPVTKLGNGKTFSRSITDIKSGS